VAVYHRRYNDDFCIFFLFYLQSFYVLFILQVLFLEMGLEVLFLVLGWLALFERVWQVSSQGHFRQVALLKECNRKQRLVWSIL
jgi:hypothetical protein